jgi:hypothetical protein
MGKVETIKYISLRVYGRNFDDISREQQINILENILDKKDSTMALCNMVSDKNFQDLKRNGYISL